MWITVLVLSASFVLLLYLYFTRNYGSYKAKGCTEMKPTFPFGSSNVWDLYTGKTALNGLMDDPYWQYKNDKFIVYWEFDQPRFVIRDIELAKRIMVKDFDHFPDRRKFDLHYSGGNKYLMNMFSIMEGDKWKLMRHILTPAFTSGKLKHMTKYIHKVADDMVLYLKDAAKKEELLETKKVMNNFTVDTIATCGFGIEANSFKNPNNPFIENVAKISTDGKDIPLRKKIEFFIMMFAPKLSQLFKLQLMDTDAAMFFISIIRETMKERRMKKHIRRNDFVDLILEHLTNTTVEEERVVENHQFENDAKLNVTTKMTFSESEIELIMVSNAFLLFFAGSDTSSTVQSVTMHFLAKNPSIQDQLLEEIKETIEKEGTEHLDYNAIHGMEYLDMVMHESLRHFMIATIERRCSKDYKIPDTDIIIKKDMLVQVSAGAIMKDPQFFSNPEEFNPLNFSTDEKSSRNPYAFLSFGQGPRNCIGMRFAMLNVKIAIMRLVNKYKLIPNAKTPAELIPDPVTSMNLLMPKGGFWVSVEAR